MGSRHKVNRPVSFSQTAKAYIPFNRVSHCLPWISQPRARTSVSLAVWNTTPPDLQFRPKLPVIVDFPIETQHDTIGLKWLQSPFQVDDLQSPVAECNPVFYKRTGCIRSAMLDPGSYHEATRAPAPEALPAGTCRQFRTSGLRFGSQTSSKGTHHIRAFSLTLVVRPCIQLRQ